MFKCIKKKKKERLFNKEEKKKKRVKNHVQEGRLVEVRKDSLPKELCF